MQTALWHMSSSNTCSQSPLANSQCFVFKIPRDQPKNCLQLFGAAARKEWNLTRGVGV